MCESKAIECLDLDRMMAPGTGDYFLDHLRINELGSDFVADHLSKLILQGLQFDENGCVPFSTPTPESNHLQISR